MPKQSDAELTQHFQDQAAFLSSSAKAFDEGHRAEATRLAQTIRVLFHDRVNIETGHVTQPCLMRQMRQLDGLEMLDTAGEPHPSSPMAHCGFTYVVLGEDTTTYYPKLQNYPTSSSIPPELWQAITTHQGRTLLLPGEWRPFTTWWTMPVLRDMEGRTFSRSDLVLWRANKDGGSHVDPRINGKYAALSRENSLGQYRGHQDDLRPMENPVTPSIRQIAYEVARSLNRRINQERVERGMDPLPEPP